MPYAFSRTYDHQVFSYDPRTRSSRLESHRTNRMLMRRYAVVQKSRDADVFGILVGTLGVCSSFFALPYKLYTYLFSLAYPASYLPLITYIRKILASHRKKSYTISVGKLTPSKLANFLEIECFVLVACPENSLIESKEFFKPIITPYELEVALKQEISWTGRYVLDFDQVMEEGKGNKQNVDESSNNNNNSQAKVDDEDTEGDAQQDFDKPHFSLVTGKYRHAKRYVTGIDTVTQSVPKLAASDSVVLRNQDSAVSKSDDSAAGMMGPLP